MKKFYITTPLYYVNAAPHIGHAYTTLAADILARYKRAHGAEVHFLTGTDEHGQKIEDMAKAMGEEPNHYADKIADEFRKLWKVLDISYSDFIRTTEVRHVERVQASFEYMLSTGDIYLGMYKGYYCVPCETYWTETEAPEEKGKRLCQNSDCRKPLTLTEEESYFFKLSKYEKPLLEHFEKHPEFLQPSQRAKEIINFVKDGLRDLAVSRTKISWGIPVKSNPKHVIYVWFEALQNYITATGYRPPGMDGGSGDYKNLWPANVQLVGKEIYRFHTAIWPAILMSLGAPLPKTVFAHGWWTAEGSKMSKSKGNFVDPREFVRDFGLDAFRYFLFREMPFGNDGDFSQESFERRYNSELANDLGNLVSRVTTLVDKKLGGVLPAKPDMDNVVVTKDILELSGSVDAAMNKMAFQEALNIIWSGIGRLNEFVDKTKPWEKEKHSDEARFLLNDLVSSLRVIAGWIAPFMPDAATKIQVALGVRRFEKPLKLEEVLAGGPSGHVIAKAQPLFPRKV
jgi:methionyl-tRNA synthetase